MMKHLGLLLGCLLLLVGCEGRDPDNDFGQTEYQTVAKTVTSEVDWSTMETVTVTIEEFSFQPSSLEFKVDKAYELILVNNGLSYHTFTAEDFFDAVAVWRLKEDDGYVEYPYLAQIGLFPKSQKSLLFVPMRPGRYNLSSGVLFFRAAGMRGQIVIR